MKLPLHILLPAVGIVALSGCAEEPVPRSTQEFLDNPMLLEAALVRCTHNRQETRYDTECVNAREAVKIVEAKEEAERRKVLEAESERKRAALRRRQQAAADARRRAEEAARRREEAEYLAQFGQLPPTSDNDAASTDGNVPLAVIPPPQEAEDTSYADAPTTALPTAGSNAPVVEAEPEPDPGTTTDLQSIREELQRRNDGD